MSPSEALGGIRRCPRYTASSPAIAMITTAIRSTIGCEAGVPTVPDRPPGGAGLQPGMFVTTTWGIGLCNWTHVP